MTELQFKISSACSKAYLSLLTQLFQPRQIKGFRIIAVPQTRGSYACPWTKLWDEVKPVSNQLNWDQNVDSRLWPELECVRPSLNSASAWQRKKWLGVSVFAFESKGKLFLSQGKQRAWGLLLFLLTRGQQAKWHFQRRHAFLSKTIKTGLPVPSQ